MTELTKEHVSRGLRERALIAKNKLRRTGTHIGRRIRREPRIIASLTSYPARINTVHLAIKSLLAQHVLPDLVVLYLCEEEFPNREEDLPTDLRQVLAHDVRIRWVNENLKPHKKYFWALQEFSNDIVITFDDDLVYRSSLIGELMNSYRRHPDAVSALRTHLITFNASGELLPYAKWVHGAPIWLDELLDKPTMQLLGTNGAGTLFPPGIMPPETFDKRAILSTCLTADDLWIKAAQLYAGVPVVSFSQDQYIGYIPDTQDVALYHENLDRGGNDPMFSAVMEHFQRLAGHDLYGKIHDRSLTYDLSKVPIEYRPTDAELAE